jgi:hypothetical protein
VGAVLPVVALLALPLAGTSAAATSCAQVRADREVAPIEAYDPRPGAPRVFATQPKPDVRNVVTYASFRARSALRKERATLKGVRPLPERGQTPPSTGSDPVEGG